MRATFGLIGSIALAVVMIGCGGAPAGPTLAPGQTATPPGATQPPGGQTQPPAGVTGHECDAIPTMDITNPNPATPVPDTTLTGHFPATIDGQPVTDVESMQWLYLMCQFGGQAAVNSAASQSGGLNITTMSFGSATANVDGEDVDISAFRTPGQDANALVQTLATIAAQSGTDINPGNVSSANIGGKNVFVWTDSDGSKGYAYPAGDTLIMFDSVTDSQATKILAALL